MQFNSDDFDSAVKSVKGLGVLLPGLSHILLKQACDYIQFLVSMGREIKDAYLKQESIKNHDIQFKAIKGVKDGPSGFPKLRKSTDVLAGGLIELTRLLNSSQGRTLLHCGTSRKIPLF